MYYCISKGGGLGDTASLANAHLMAANWLRLGENDSDGGNDSGWGGNDSGREQMIVVGEIIVVCEMIVAGCKR